MLKYLLKWKVLAALAIVALALWWFTALVSGLAKLAFGILIIGVIVGFVYSFFKGSK